MNCTQNYHYIKQPKSIFLYTCLLVGMGLFYLFAVTGAVVLVGGIVISYFNNKRYIIDDCQYDNNVMLAPDELEKRAVEFLNIDGAEIRKIFSDQVYVYEGAEYYRKGSDGLWRTEKLLRQCIILCNEKVFIYKNTVDTTTAEEEVDSLSFDLENIKSIKSDKPIFNVELRAGRNYRPKKIRKKTKVYKAYIMQDVLNIYTKRKDEESDEVYCIRMSDAESINNLEKSIAI